MSRRLVLASLSLLSGFLSFPGHASSDMGASDISISYGDEISEEKELRYKIFQAVLNDNTDYINKIGFYRGPEYLKSLRNRLSEKHESLLDMAVRAGHVKMIDTLVIWGFRVHNLLFRIEPMSNEVRETLIRHAMNQMELWDLPRAIGTSLQGSSQNDPETGSSPSLFR